MADGAQRDDVKMMLFIVTEMVMVAVSLLVAMLAPQGASARQMAATNRITYSPPSSGFAALQIPLMLEAHSCFTSRASVVASDRGPSDRTLLVCPDFGFAFEGSAKTTGTVAVKSLSFFAAVVSAVRLSTAWLASALETIRLGCRTVELDNCFDLLARAASFGVHTAMISETVWAFNSSRTTWLYGQR